MRAATIEVVEGIASWRTSLAQPEPFRVRGQNYLVKAVDDSSFMQKFADVRRELGFDIGKKNPFGLPIRASWSEDMKASRSEFKPLN
jgi:hypothetical protein